MSRRLLGGKGFSHGGGGGGGGSSPTWTQTAAPAIDHQGFGGPQTSPFSAAVNNPRTSDVLIVALANNNGVNVASVTADGHAMTLVVNSGAGNQAAIYQVTGFLFTTASIVVTNTPQPVNDNAIIVGYLSHVTAAATSTCAYAVMNGQPDNHTFSGALTVPSTGIGLIVGSAAATVVNIDGVTPDVTTSNSSMVIALSKIIASTTPYLSGTGTNYGSNVMGAAAAWGP